MNNTADVFGRHGSAADRADVLFLSSDNTVIAGVAGAVKVAVDKKIPLFVGDSGTVEKGGVAAVSVGYHELGLATGALLVQTLQGCAAVTSVVVVASGSELYLNTLAAQKMGLTIPPSILKRATKVFDTIP